MPIFVQYVRLVRCGWYQRWHFESIQFQFKISISHCKVHDGICLYGSPTISTPYRLWVKNNIELNLSTSKCLGRYWRVFYALKSLSWVATNNRFKVFPFTMECWFIMQQHRRRWLTAWVRRLKYKWNVLHNVDIEKSSTVKRWLARAKIAKKDFFKILNLGHAAAYRVTFLLACHFTWKLYHHMPL